METRPYRRRRPPLSCIECRRRKVKCNRGNPCEHCSAARIKCTYRAITANAASPSSLRQSGTSIEVRNEQGTTLTDDASSRTTIVAVDHEDHRPTLPIFSASGHINSTTGERNDASNRSGTLADSAHNYEADPTDGRQQIPHMERLPQTTSEVIVEPDRGYLELRSQFQDAQISLNKSRILKWTHWMGAAQEFSTILACFAATKSKDDGGFNESEELTAMMQTISDLLTRCKTLAAMSKIGRPSRCSPWPKLKLSSPSREIADEMAHIYFDTFESVYRILHAPTFWSEYEQYWTNPGGSSTSIGFKVHLAIAIGSSLRKPGDTSIELRNMLQQWVYAAQVWLSGPLEKDRLDISGIQIYCLTVLARQVLSVGGDLIWMSVGSLIHRAMQTGLHRDPKHFASMSVLQAEVRRRLWATILEMTVQSSLDAGMPPRISFDEFDTEPPSNVNDNDLQNSIMTTKPHPIGSYTATSIQLLLLESLPSRHRAVQILNGLHKSLSYLDVLSVSSQISDACRRCNEFVRGHKASGMTAFHANLLDYLLRRFLLSLHCPFASQVRTNLLFSYSLKVSVDTAMAIMTPEPDDKYSSLLTTAGGFMKEGLRSAATAVSLELLTQVEL